MSIKFNIQRGDMIKIQITDSTRFVFPTTEGNEAYGYVEGVAETGLARSGAFAYTYFFDIDTILPIEIDRAIKVQ